MLECPAAVFPSCSRQQRKERLCQATPQRKPAWRSAEGKGAAPSQIEQLLAPLSRSAGLVTLIHGAPASLSWLGGVLGQRVSPLGIDRFGQTGDLGDLYREYRLDVDAIVEAAAELFLD